MTCNILWLLSNGKFIIFHNIAHNKQYVHYEKGAVIMIAMIAIFMPHNYGCYAMLSLSFFTILLMISNIAQIRLT